MFKERLEIARAYIQTHKNEMVIMGIMFGMSLAMGIALATGDNGDAIARARGH